MGKGYGFYGKVTFWEETVQVQEEMKRAHFTLALPNFDAAAIAFVGCLRKGISDWGFEENVNNDFFRFL